MEDKKERRDMFACFALMGLLSVSRTGTHKQIAKEAFTLADAMLEESEKSPQGDTIYKSKITMARLATIKSLKNAFDL
jgi:hypothetical protein